MTLSPAFESALSELLDAWSNHLILHKAGAEPIELHDARQRLDAARRSTARARRLG